MRSSASRYRRAGRRRGGRGSTVLEQPSEQLVGFDGHRRRRGRGLHQVDAVGPDDLGSVRAPTGSPPGRSTSGKESTISSLTRPAGHHPGRRRTGARDLVPEGCQPEPLDLVHGREHVRRRCARGPRRSRRRPWPSGGGPGRPSVGSDRTLRNHRCSMPADGHRFTGGVALPARPLGSLPQRLAAPSRSLGQLAHLGVGLQPQGIGLDAEAAGRAGDGAEGGAEQVVVGEHPPLAGVGPPTSGTPSGGGPSRSTYAGAAGPEITAIATAGGRAQRLPGAPSRRRPAVRDRRSAASRTMAGQTRLHHEVPFPVPPAAHQPGRPGQQARGLLRRPAAGEPAAPGRSRGTRPRRRGRPGAARPRS